MDIIIRWFDLFILVIWLQGLFMVDFLIHKDQSIPSGWLLTAITTDNMQF